MSQKHNDSASSNGVIIDGEGRDEFGHRYYKFRIRCGKFDLAPVPVDQLFGDCKQFFAKLAHAGWNGFTPKVRQDLLERVQKSKFKSPCFKVVTRLGWNSGAYVFPDQIIGSPRERLECAFGNLDLAMRRKYRTGGTLNDWQATIARRSAGNSRLMFAISLAFTGPVLPLAAGPRSGGFQIWGGAEAGKTTVAKVAGSVWGCHRSGGRRDRGFAETWNSTAGKMELTALAHNNGLLILDETKHAGKSARERAQTVTAVVFGLSESTEKDRLTNPQPVQSWRCYFLSTSNQSLLELARSGGIEVDDAARGRLVDIPLPRNGQGVFEELHEFPDGAMLSDILQRACRQHFGTVGRRFVRKLVTDASIRPKRLKAFIRKRRKMYLKAVRRRADIEGLRPLNRASGRFATVYAAGTLAHKYGLVPWSRKTLLRAILSCQVDQLRHDRDNPVSAPTSVADLRAKLTDYLKLHLKDFPSLAKRRPRYGIDKINGVGGYRAKVNGQRYFYLTAAQLGAIVGPTNADAVKMSLANDGLLECGKDGRFVVQRRLFDGGKGNQNFVWVHAIKADILDTPAS